MILADTSAWVEYDRATGSPAHLRVGDLIRTGGALCVTEPVIMELSAGARSERQESEIRRLLTRFETLTFDPTLDFDAATRIHRRCRSSGVTPRGLIDCMIAAVAYRRGATLLAHDADLDRIARTLGIAVDAASLRTTD